MDRRKFNKTLLVGGLTAISGCLSHPLPPLKGAVVGRSIVATGAPSGDSRTVLLRLRSDRSGSSQFHAEVRDAGPGFVLHNPSYERLTAEFHELEYYVTIRHEADDGFHMGPNDGAVRTYSTKKSLFNSIQLDDFVSITKGVTDSITELQRIIRRGTVVNKDEQTQDATNSDPPLSEYAGHVALDHEFEDASAEKQYPATKRVYRQVEAEQEFAFGVERDRTHAEEQYLYLSSVNPSRTWSIY
ncbi:hypothetical protein ACNS7O_01210 [Haloferacaceae archaeon DSL9]